jgi:DNA polymerase IV
MVPERAPPVILHADMDAFYTSVEQRDRPELRGKPVVVGGPPPRGVVAAASYEARVFGVRSAMPSAEALARCPHAHFLRGDMKKYGRESRRLREIFEELSPDVEPISLDEAFIDVSTTLRALKGSPREIGERLKQRVFDETGLRVSVGIGPTKMVAKIASDLSKPDGLLVVEPEEVGTFLAPLPIGRLWGVGEVTEAALLERGLRTIGDLALLAEASLPPGLRSFWRLARGEDARLVEAHRDARSYGEENTFARDVSDREEICDAIGQHADAVAHRLRHDRVRGDVVRLKVKSTERLARPGRYRLYSRQTTLPAPTDDGTVIRDAACGLFRRGDLPLPIRLVGVAVAGIRSAAHAGEQLAMFEPRRRRELNQALDTITARFGSEIVRRGAGRATKAAPSLGVKRGVE